MNTKFTLDDSLASICFILKKFHDDVLLQMATCSFLILGDPGADSGDEEKSKRAEKYMARRKVKNGEKSKFSGTNQKPERRRPFGTGLVRHCPQGLFSPFFTFLRAIYFSASLDFSLSPLSAPGSPRMLFSWKGE